MDNIKYTPEVQEILEDPETTEADRELFRNLVKMNQRLQYWNDYLEALRRQREAE